MNKTISVYFSGTGFSINDSRFLATFLYARTEENESQIKMGFNGCGVDYGLSGVIFGTGLDKQCDKVIARVMQEMSSGHHVTLNVYGHSRGGIAAFLLAKQLGNLDKEKLAINLAVLDPVPGNFITTSSIDPLEISLVNKTMDLSDCKPLRKVLALYPYKPLPAIACHAPLLISYPKSTEVDEEVVTGCHAQTEQIADPTSQLVRLRVEEFLVQNGTTLRTDRDYKNSEVIKQIYLLHYQQELASVNQATSRPTHSVQGVVLIATTGAKYLNSRHKTLAGDSTQEPVALSIQHETGFFSKLKKLANYSPVRQAVQWTLVGLPVTGLLYATGGLAAIPLLGALASQFGTFSLVALSPVAGGALATLWYGATKPIVSWGTNKLIYPHYTMRAIETPNVETEHSTKRLMDILGAKRVQTKATIGSVPYQGTSPLHTERRTVQEPPHDWAARPALAIDLM